MPVLFIKSFPGELHARLRQTAGGAGVFPFTLNRDLTLAYVSRPQAATFLRHGGNPEQRAIKKLE